MKFFDGALALTSIDGRPLMLAFGICGGAGLYFSLPSEPDLDLALTGSGMMLCLWLVARRWVTSDIVITLIVLAFGVSAGLSAAAFRARSVAAPVIAAETGPVMVEGWVQEIEPGRRGVRLLIRVHSIANMSNSDWPEYVRVTHTSRLEVAPGRFVRCWSVLRPPPGPAMPGEYDFKRQAWFEQLGAVGYVQGRCRGGALGAPNGVFQQAGLRLGAARRYLALSVNEAAGERAGGFAAALVSGDRSFMLNEDAEALRNTGLAHLLAISGLHLSIVGGLVFLFVKRVLALIEPIALRVAVQKPAAIIALIACLTYLVISGASVSTQRAFIMAAIVFGAVIFDRSAISLRTFALAMIAVVLLQPESVVTPGFQMSFAATGALIAAYEMWRDRRSGKENVLGPVAFSWVSIGVTSLVAGLATMPYALFHFDRASPIGFVANLVAMPIVTFMSAPSAAIAFLLAPFGLSEIGLRLFGYSLELVMMVAHYFSQFSGEGGTVERSMPPSSMLLATLALASFIAMKGWLRLLAGSAFVLASLAIWAAAPRFVAHWSPSGDLFLSSPAGGIERFGLVKGDGLAPMRFSEVVASQCERECNFTTKTGVTVGVQPTDDTRLCFDTSAVLKSAIAPVREPETCWAWAEITEQGGKSAYLKGARLQIVTASGCGARPWNTCGVIASPQGQ